jgi:hypothetical protein
MTSVWSSVTEFADINGLVLSDHHLFEFLHKQFNSELNQRKKYFIAKRLIREIQHHFSAVQELVYPELKKHLGNKADYLINNETKLNQKLLGDVKEMEEMDFNSAQFKARFFILRQDLRPHEQFEENTLMLTLMPLLKMEDNERIVKEWRVLKHKLQEADRDVAENDEQKQKEIKTVTFKP